MNFITILFSLGKIRLALSQIYLSLEAVSAFLKKAQKEFTAGSQMYLYLESVIKFMGTLIMVIAKLIKIVGGEIPQVDTQNMLLANIDDEIEKLKNIKL